MRKVTAVAVNSTILKGTVRDAVQFYFRSARQSVVELGIDDAELDRLDAAFQLLNDLAQGNNRKKSYLDNLKLARGEVSKLSIVRFRLLGARAQDGKIMLTSMQAKIIATLNGMLPASASSYAQALKDLTDGSRLSFRGAATELREVLREVIGFSEKYRSDTKLGTVLKREGVETLGDLLKNALICPKRP